MVHNDTASTNCKHSNQMHSVAVIAVCHGEEPYTIIA